jgi:hypothetical protein
MEQHSQTERRAIQQELGESGLGVSRMSGIIPRPQPTHDPGDPLNWTTRNKHCILGIVMFKYVLQIVKPPRDTADSLMNRYFMFTYITTTTIPSFLELQELYNITYSQVTWTVAVPSLGLCLGPLIWSSFSEIYGRRLIFIIGTTIALLATIGTASATNYPTYMAARAIQGLGASPGGTVGMAIINECVTYLIMDGLMANDIFPVSFSSTRGARKLACGYCLSTRVSWSDQSAGLSHHSNSAKY